MTNLSTIVKISKLLEENHRTYNDVEEEQQPARRYFKIQRKHQVVIESLS